jgi:hypothetical protein
MMQHIQDRMLQEKNLELSLLQNQVDEQQKELMQNKVEIAILKVRMENVMMQCNKVYPAPQQHLENQHGSATTFRFAPTAAAMPASLSNSKQLPSSTNTNRTHNCPATDALPLSIATSDTEPTSKAAAEATTATNSNGSKLFTNKATVTPAADTVVMVPSFSESEFDPMNHTLPPSGLKQDDDGHNNSGIDTSRLSSPGKVNKMKLRIPAPQDIPGTLGGSEFQSFHTPHHLLNSSAQPMDRSSRVDESINHHTLHTNLNHGDEPDDDSVDNASIDNSIASSTFGDVRQQVVSHMLADASGDCGRYSGVILRSTRLPHGRGEMIYDNGGGTYEGDWRHGRWHGSGLAINASGDLYEGEYRSDQRHGRGKWFWANGRVYDGEFRDDKRHGNGTFEWPNGDKYTGEFHKGKKEGHGRYTFSDGGYYDGGWIDDRYEGFGGMFLSEPLSLKIRSRSFDLYWHTH